MHAVDEAGEVVPEGTVLSDFRDHQWTYQYPTQPTVPGKSGKVYAISKHDKWGMELYASVFNLRVER